MSDISCEKRIDDELESTVARIKLALRTQEILDKCRSNDVDEAKLEILTRRRNGDMEEWEVELEGLYFEELE